MQRKILRKFLLIFKDAAETLAKDLQAGKYAEYQIDLMDENSIARLNKTGAVTDGTYQYAVITRSLRIQFRPKPDSRRPGYAAIYLPGLSLAPIPRAKRYERKRSLWVLARDR